MFDLILTWLGDDMAQMIFQNEMLLGYVIAGITVACAVTACAVMIYIIDMLCGAFKQLWKRG